MRCGTQMHPRVWGWCHSTAWFPQRSCAGGLYPPCGSQRGVPCPLLWALLRERASFQTFALSPQHWRQEPWRAASGRRTALGKTEEAFRSSEMRYLKYWRPKTPVCMEELASDVVSSYDDLDIRCWPTRWEVALQSIQRLGPAATWPPNCSCNCVLTWASRNTWWRSWCRPEPGIPECWPGVE